MASIASMIIANGPAIRVQFVLDDLHSNGTFILSNSGQTATATSDPAFPYDTVVRFAGKYYVEFVLNTLHITIPQSIGLANATPATIGAQMIVNNGPNPLSISTSAGGGGIITTDLTSQSDGAVFAIAWNADNGKVWFGVKVGSVIQWANSGNPGADTGANTNLGAGTLLYAIIEDTSSSGGGQPMTVNGQLGQFAATPPLGFLSWEGW